MSQISLVGAGPGPLELLTLRALHRLEAAEVVVYDRLVGSEILARIPHGAARFDVGKRCGEPSPTQEEINALLLALARTGKRVVRLKGGDPLVFGRGGEEALHLARHGMTHRGLARSLTLVTGHLMDERDYQGWQGLTRAGHTLVFYMGLERAAQIRQGLLASPRQQVHEATLDGLEQAARALLGQSPVLIIMGEVVRLRAELQGLLTEALERVA